MQATEKGPGIEKVGHGMMALHGRGKTKCSKGAKAERYMLWTECWNARQRLRGHMGKVAITLYNMLTFELYNRSVTKSQNPSDKPNSASGHDKRTSPVSFSRNSNPIRTTRLEATFK